MKVGDFKITRPYGRLRIEYTGSRIYALLSTEAGKITIAVRRRGEHMCPITHRSFSEYQELYKIPEGFVPEPDKQYLEVGAGLGEFVPKIVRELDDRLSNRPVVIDPVDYGLLIEMLYIATEEGMDEENDLVGRELTGRARIITDSEKVKLYNLTLEEAVRNHPELTGCADLVVDCAGASSYSRNTALVSELEKLLLKENWSHDGYFSQTISPG
jgi:hypothetical protein